MEPIHIVNCVLKNLSFLDDIQPDQRLEEDLGFDSLKLVEVIVALENAFGVEIDEAELDPARLNTVSDLYCLMHRYERSSLCCIPS